LKKNNYFYSKRIGWVQLKSGNGYSKTKKAKGKATAAIANPRKKIPHHNSKGKENLQDT